MDSTGNLFSALSSYLINFKTPRQLGAAGYALAKDYTAFLMQVKADANKISSYILKQQPKTSTSSQSTGGFQNGSRL